MHRKRRCEMLIGGDDISDDVITPGACFSMFVYKRRSFPLRTDWRKSDSSFGGEPQGNWMRWDSNSRDVVASSPSFSLSNARAPSNFVVTCTSLCQPLNAKAGADPGFFLGGGALVSCSTSTPINHIVFFSAEYQLY